MSKLRPMLFSAPMVRALLDGTKTQTRRIVKPQPEWAEPNTEWANGDGHSGTGWYAYNSDYPDEGSLFYRCPYGEPGDTLWVRETFSQIYPQDPTYNNGQPIEYDYAATYQHGDRLGDSIGIKKVWKPSIHMPRRASRITLVITSVRVERLQDISRGDAMEEGCPFPNMAKGADPRRWYESLWESINGAGSWFSNPWVWVIEFRVLK